MIDLFAIADGMLGVIHPMQDATLKVSTGSITEDDGSITPTYDSIPVQIEIQATTSSDLQLLQNISQQSDLRIIYMRGAIHALNRPLQTGGDLLVFDKSEWLVTQVLEQWGAEDWCKLAVTRQIPGKPTSF